MKEWYSIAEMRELPEGDFNKTKFGLQKYIADRNWDADKNRAREVDGNGGTRKEYHYSLFPQPLQTKIIHKAMLEEVGKQAEPTRAEIQKEALWEVHARAPQSMKDTAAKRFSCMKQVDQLISQGTLQHAFCIVADANKVSTKTLSRWYKDIRGVCRTDWLAALVPSHVGRVVKADCDRRAWDHLVSNYLRNSEPSFRVCYDQMFEAAGAHGWTPVPSYKTMYRRVFSEIGTAAITLARKGEAAAASLYPAQTRDHSVFHAMEAVNADGHVFDVFVKWADGTIGRPIVVGFQDVYSGFVLSHRISRTENSELVRLAVADMIESWGIPEHAYFDNGRAFMNKCLTGRMKFRFRFKVREEDPEGILEHLNVQVHAVTPYRGQSKPIERAWRDMVDRISKHPAFAGAYTGNNTNSKPADYGSRAIPIDEFKKVVAQEILRHNVRPGRRGQTANGRSFAEVFKDSLEQPTTMVRKATEYQRQLFLMAGEAKQARKGNGEIYLANNRYWSESLVEYAGQKVVVRFDPQNLHDDLHVYTLDNRYIDKAPCIEATGYNDANEAREHAANRRKFTKACREMVKFSKLLSPAQVAAQIPDPDPMDMPMPKVVGLLTSGSSLSLPTNNQDADRAASEAFGRGIAASVGVDNIFEMPKSK